ncbi:hypothetical protein KR222_008134 [Zaprionus bogoriensis]|nr:hypothetical protein KR222_008134 [Zaprionus bogoriensis]
MKAKCLHFDLLKNSEGVSAYNRRELQKLSLEERKSYQHQASRPSMRSDEFLAITSEVRSTGAPLAEDKAQQALQHMCTQITSIVRSSVQLHELDMHNYYFLMVNCLDNELCTPDELSIAQFSLQGGVHRIFHTHIDTGCHHLEGIYADLLHFMGLEPEPVFTPRAQISQLNVALKCLNGGVSSQINVLPIEQLFHVLKLATCAAGMRSAPASLDETDFQFNFDPYEHVPNIACAYHEERDMPNICAKSCVTRWGYSFAAYMCPDLAIEMCPNRHMPESLLKSQSTRAVSDCSEPKEEEAEFVVKIEPIPYDEAGTNAFVVNALNDLGLDNIFDDDKEEDRESIECEYKAEVEKLMTHTNAVPEEVPPVLPATDLQIESDCNIFTRRPEQPQLKKEDQTNSVPSNSSSLISEILSKFANQKEDDAPSNVKGSCHGRSRSRSRSLNRRSSRSSSSSRRSRWRQRSISRNRKHGNQRISHNRSISRNLDRTRRRSRSSSSSRHSRWRQRSGSRNRKIGNKRSSRNRSKSPKTRRLDCSSHSRSPLRSYSKSIRNTRRISRSPCRRYSKRNGEKERSNSKTIRGIHRTYSSTRRSHSKSIAQSLSKLF